MALNHSNIPANDWNPALSALSAPPYAPRARRSAFGASLVAASVLSVAMTLRAGEHAPRQMEWLDRAPVAVRMDAGHVFVGWRLLGDDPENIAFNLYRDGARVNEAPLTAATSFVNATPHDGQYTVRAVVDGRERAPTAPVGVWADQILRIPLQRPDEEGYAPNDASVGDLDGDGVYEIVLKWDKGGKDNSHAGRTPPVFLDAYRLDGTRLWRINLGPNIRAGAHYTQFLVYDFDGDGRAEVVCKTADGTVDGVGAVIGDPDADYRNDKGYILAGPEFLTVFDGLTGRALATTDYIPPRSDRHLAPTADEMKKEWGDSYGNRVDRFLACVAYLDGTRPSIVMARGYYTRTVLAAFDWRGGVLTHRWTFDSKTPGNEGYAGMGNHNLAVADVDGDGRDEIMYGACAIDDDGTGLYTTGMGHGDAGHLTDIDPERPGLEYFMCHEWVSAGHGLSLRDAATGEVLWQVRQKKDVGRGMAADLLAEHPGLECWGMYDPNLYNAKGEVVGPAPQSMNFGIWWDGDLLRELLDHGSFDKTHWRGVGEIRKYDGTPEGRLLLRAAGTFSNNGTKGTPVLQADLFGDWREEVIWRSEDASELRLYTTTIPTEHRLPTLMHDPVYRLSVAWQNVAYNQPPHPGYFLGVGMRPPPRPNIALIRAK